jgi:uncharacterized protein (TIGR03032 family)
MREPLFLIATADGDADVLLDALALADGVWTTRGEPDWFRQSPPDGGTALHAALSSRDGDASEPAPDDAVVVAAGPASLARAFPAARFVFLAGADDGEIPAELATLDPSRVLRVDHDALLGAPREELNRVCTFAAIVYDQALLSPIEAARRAAAPADATSLASVSTASLTQVLSAAGSSLLISTYQTNKLVCARTQQDGGLNTHFRDFDKPMGVAVAPGRIALGTRTEVWDLRDMPEAAAAVESAGAHDACYLPRNRHVTGDIAVHDLAFAGGQLWLVATAFSCLATLDADHSFVPRWAPPFITTLASEDRCHLNGMAVVGDRVAYVTALGQTDEPGGWRAGKATDGVLLDVATSEVVAGGLSMPHSPRWHAGRLWFLESGKGALSTVDVTSGDVQTVTELPGFTRGLAFLGDVAFVGLSQVRESSTFGDLPLTRRLRERQSGVWMVDLRTGEVAGFLRFEDLVQEIFDVALLPGARFPEIAEATGATVASSFVLP